MSTETSTGFRKIYYSRKLQDYWIRRLVAFIIDALMINIALWIIFAIIAAALWVISPWWWTNMFVFPFFSGILFVLYSAFMENVYGYTFGKRIMVLKVITREGKKPTIDLAFLRNMTKIYWLLLLLDAVIALALPGDPTKKYTDTFARTSVVLIESSSQ